MTDKKDLFIGSRKIRAVLDDPDDKDGVLVHFTDNTNGKLKRKLFDAIKRDEKGDGDKIGIVADTYIAFKFLKELGELGYERHQLISIVGTMSNLLESLTEEKIGEKFGVNASINIKISDII